MTNTSGPFLSEQSNNIGLQFMQTS